MPSSRLQQLIQPVDLADAGVVTGRDPIGAEPERMVEERAELDLAVAQHVGIRRAAGLGTRRRKCANTRSRYSAAKLTCFDLDADDVGDAGRIDPGPRATSSTRRSSSSSQFFMKTPTTS
mgnify:CR=1 FL=1